LLAEKNKTPGRVADRGFENCSGGDPALLGRLWVSGAPVAKPIPEVITSGCNLLRTNDRGANGTGIGNVQGYRVQGHADLQKMTEPYSSAPAGFNQRIQKVLFGYQGLDRWL